MQKTKKILDFHHKHIKYTINRIKNHIKNSEKNLFDTVKPI